MGDCKIAKAVLRGFVLFAGIVLLNAAQYVKNLDCPPDILRLMVGSKLELKWHYEMNVSFRDSWKINLYVHKSDSKRRKLIELHRGHTELRPGSNSWADKMDLSYTSAKITVLKTTFNHTGDYGIMFVPLNKRKTDILTKYTVVTIVDMLLDEEKSSFVEKTWINEPAELVCAVNLKDNADAPTFKWKHSKNGTVTKNVFKERDRSVLRVNARDVNDFGSYKCQIKTVHTKIKHNMTLKRIEYPGYPTEIVFSRKKLSWLSPMRWKSVFSVQYLINKQKKNWMEVGRTLEKTIHSKSLSKFLPHGVHFCCVRICINVTTTLRNKICSPGKMVEDSPDVSPPSTTHLTYHGNEAILTWSRSDYNEKDIIGYVVQIFHGSDYSSKSMTSKHLYEKPEKNEYVITNVKDMENAIFRVCIRRSLCLFEESCSEKVSFSSVLPTEPMEIKIEFHNKTEDIKVSWTQPRKLGKGNLLYIVEVQNEAGATIKTMFTLEQTAVLKLPSKVHYVKVCARSDVNLLHKSCSERYLLGNATEESSVVGSGRHSTISCENMIFLISIMIAISIC